MPAPPFPTASRTPRPTSCCWSCWRSGRRACSAAWRARRYRRAMRFQFKTSYNQDIRLFKDRVDVGWYGLLAAAVVALPMLMSDYYVGEATWVFIYGICGVSLMVLVGYTGLVSLGHAAFLGIGAYAHAYFLKHGIPWIPSVVLAVMITTASGIVVGLPALRMTGIY